jgi:hypothetical protein
MKGKKECVLLGDFSPSKFPSKQVFMTRIYDGIAFLHAWYIGMQWIELAGMVCKKGVYKHVIDAT